MGDLIAIKGIVQKGVGRAKVIAFAARAIEEEHPSAAQAVV